MTSHVNNVISSVDDRGWDLVVKSGIVLTCLNFPSLVRRKIKAKNVLKILM